MTNNRIIYDLCTPTAERRPTTTYDVVHDVRIEDFDSPEELYDALLDIYRFDEYDEEELEGSLEERIKTILSIYSDYTDGSPNILYLLLNGKEIPGTIPYDPLKKFDLRNISQRKLQKVIIDAIEDDYDSFNSFI